MTSQRQKFQAFKKKLSEQIAETVKAGSRKVDFAQFSNFLNAENSIAFKEGAENNYALHQRVSTFKQVEDGESLETQEKMAKKIVKENKGKIFKTYLEEGVSATKKKLSERPKMLELLDDFQDGNFKNIISYNQDRLFRNEKEAPSILLFLIMNGVNIYYTRGGTVKLINQETLGEFGILEIMMNAKRARQETQATSERVADNRHEMFLKGMIVQSYIPYGYERNKDKKVVQIEEEIEMIKQVEEFYLNGIGYSTIAKWLNGEKTKRIEPRKSKFERRKIRKDDSNNWTKEVVEGLLFNKFYHGIITNNYRGKETEEIESKQHIPFRSKERYEQLIKFKNKKKEKQLPPRHYDSDYLLKELLFCKECNNKFYTRSTSRKNGTTHGYYLCKGIIDGTRLGTNICNNKNYNTEMLEAFVLLKIKNYLSRLDLSLIARDLSQNLNQDDKKLDFELDNIEKQLSKLKEEYKGLQIQIRRKLAQKDKEKDEFEKELLEEEISELEKEEREYKLNMKELTENRSQLMEEIENENLFEYEMSDVFDQMKYFVDHFDEVIDYRKKILVEQIVKKILIDSEGNVEIEYVLPLDELVKTASEMAVSMESSFYGGVSDLTTPKNGHYLYSEKPIYIKDCDHIDDSNFKHWIEEIYIEARSKFKEFLIGTTLKYTENGRINAWQLANKTGITHYTAKAYFNYSHFPTKEKMIQVLKPFNTTPEDFVKYLNLDNYIDSNLLFEIMTCVSRWFKTETINESVIGEEIKRRVDKYKEKNTLNKQVIYSTRNVIVEEWVIANG
jgi:site-specific DNA recombinase